ncbi:HNH endonuclease [Hyphomicrobium sp. GJ21]|uniref:HNH endonuclease n=1 Tax=Hyphomicrobium sp. GJ21 TaxID=113574 RepID=UPI00062BBB42|nr:HNH endonuclease [Hyphomicrobium sp. GJ21]
MGRLKQNDPIRRASLFHEQDGLCFYCTSPMLVTRHRPRHPREVTLEHLISFAEGGRRGFPNEVAACNACNNRRGTTPWLLFFCLMEIERAETPPRPAKLVPSHAGATS